MSYRRFAAMIATSTVVMYGLMYLNTYALEHVFWSETRLWMAVVMGATMAVVMLGFMLRMYSQKLLNLGIFAGAVAAFALALWLVRSQATVDDVEYLHAMIPHHSIAIMTSERAQISNPGVRKLADEIIEAQEREIAEMKYLASADSAEPRTPQPQQAPRIVGAHEALAGADVPTVDPHTMNDAEIGKVIGAGQFCAFRYTSTGNPVLAFSPQASGSRMSGIVKLNGSLVPLHGNARRDEVELAADEIHITLELEDERGRGSAPAAQPMAAQMVFRVGERLRVGYDGYYACIA